MGRVEGGGQGKGTGGRGGEEGGDGWWQRKGQEGTWGGDRPDKGRERGRVKEEAGGRGERWGKERDVGGTSVS